MAPQRHRQSGACPSRKSAGTPDHCLTYLTHSWWVATLRRQGTVRHRHNLRNFVRTLLPLSLRPCRKQVTPGLALHPSESVKPRFALPVCRESGV